MERVRGTYLNVSNDLGQRGDRDRYYYLPGADRWTIIAVLKNAGFQWDNSKTPDALARIHRWTRMEGVRTAEGG